MQSQVRVNWVSEKVPVKVWEALGQSQVRFNRVPEKVPKLPEKVWKALVQTQSGSTGFGRRIRRSSGRLWCRAKPDLTRFREKVWAGRLWCSQVRFNRVPEKVPALGFAARFRKICNNKTLRLLGIPPKLILHMTWENLRRILGLPGKTSANSFFSSHVERCFDLFSRVGSGGFPNAQNEARGAVGAVHASQESGGKGLGWFRMV